MINQPQNSSPSNAVRVWKGYKLPNNKTFYKKLGNTFIPVTVQFMSPLGLNAYFPLVLPQEKEPQIPDELALVFYNSQEQYLYATKETSTGRAYSQLHSTLFNFSISHSSFPCQIPQILSNGSYYVFGGIHYWKSLQIDCFITHKNKSIKQLSGLINQLKIKPQPGLDEIFIHCDDYHIYLWFCSNNKSGNSISIIPNDIEVIYHFTSKPLFVNPDPDARNDIYIKGGEFFNIHF